MNGAFALRPRGNGFAAEGPGFYVWDEEPSALQEEAAELWDASLRLRIEAAEEAWAGQKA